jgi:hypothetical protein
MRLWYNEDFSGNSKSLLIAMAGAFVKKPGQFEWKNTWTYKYKSLDYKKFYVADWRKSWWWGMKADELKKFQPGHGPFALAGFIRGFIDKANVEQFAIMGLSMGGYGAIMLGALLGADEVITFSPQTSLTQFRIEKAKLDIKYKGLNVDMETTQLKNFLAKYNNDKTKYHIYYGSQNKGDTKHAKDIEHIKNVFLHPVPLKKHTVAGPLIQDGTVSEIIKEFVERKK